MEAEVAFGRRQAEEPPVEPVDWADVRTFVVSDIERPVTTKRKRLGFGKRAVRVAKGPKDLRVMAPCAFVASGPRPGLSAPAAHTLYEDAGESRLLCYVEPAVEVDGEQRYVVRDGQGQELGTLTRVPPKRRPFKHTWRIEQPGHPPVSGLNEWVSGDAKEIAGRAAGKFIGGVLGAIGDLGAEGGDQPSKPRTLEWRAEDTVVMVSQGSAEVTVRAEWIDRRLAFAFALVGDQ
ncbi:hypothetical protein [Streptomyces sp. TLI_55]|uniref:hypothetical protein n=1 Tax=Streptomyces sp. TLI_55 TaxID=1938861 RepID=UPI00117D96A4|nr:hypothetical protein [Streptomyces sp. TLI_55]